MKKFLPKENKFADRECKTRNPKHILLITRISSWWASEVWAGGSDDVLAYDLRMIRRTVEPNHSPLRLLMFSAFNCLAISS
jgi:hypothetical protein